MIFWLPLLLAQLVNHTLAKTFNGFHKAEVAHYLVSYKILDIIWHLLGKLLLDSFKRLYSYMLCSYQPKSVEDS